MKFGRNSQHLECLMVDFEDHVRPQHQQKGNFQSILNPRVFSLIQDDQIHEHKGEQEQEGLPDP